MGGLTSHETLTRRHRSVQAWQPVNPRITVDGWDERRQVNILSSRWQRYIGPMYSVQEGQAVDRLGMRTRVDCKCQRTEGPRGRGTDGQGFRIADQMGRGGSGRCEVCLAKLPQQAHASAKQMTCSYRRTLFF